jgi:hypothetical protein
MRTLNLHIAIVAAVLLAGCEFFDNGNDDSDFGDGDSSGTTSFDSGNDTDEPEPPREGFRVFPRYLLQDVPAVVTVEREAVQYECPLDDGPEGGYVCDATAQPAGPVTITVERDGFDTAIRNPELVPETIVPLEVHLAPAGGATGTWSSCVAANAFLTCGDVCANEMLGCAVASCATGQEEWPIATLTSFSDGECVATVENLVFTCDDPLSAVSPAEAVRCCCAAP